jgi:hypothetical protein
MFLPVLVNDGIEGETVSPGGGEVSHVHIVVASSLQLAPDIKCQLVLGQLTGSTPNGMITVTGTDRDYVSHVTYVAYMTQVR